MSLATRGHWPRAVTGHARSLATRGHWPRAVTGHARSLATRGHWPRAGKRLGVGGGWPVHAGAAGYARQCPIHREPCAGPIDVVVGFAAVALLIVANAFFVASEFALVAVDRSRIEQLANEGRRSARIALGLIKRLSFHLSGAQLGITITSVVLGFVAEPTVGRVIEPVFGSLPGGHGASIVLALLLATVLQMVFGELVPKTFAIARPVPTATRLAVPMRLFGLALGPVIKGLNGAANWILRRCGVEPVEELASVRSIEELEFLIRSSEREGTLDVGAVSLLTRSIRFGEKTAADILVPRVALEAVMLEQSADELIELSRSSGFSRFPVYGIDLDDIRGSIHVKVLHRVPVSERATTQVSQLMTEAFVVPESRELRSLLLEMRERGSHLAVVVDEYGGTAGIVTLEDLVEEIVGEIEDEYDVGPHRHHRQRGWTGVGARRVAAPR